jgi:hypothetical protein
MRMLRVGLFALPLLLLAAQVAIAGEATTYTGSLGKIPIVVELQLPGADGAFVGRYAYLKKGVDIPLHGKATADGFAIEEEAPCTTRLCAGPDGQALEKPPIGADWTLAREGATLSGTWKDLNSGKSLPLTLEKKGRRPLSDDDSGMDLLDPTFSAAIVQIPAFVTARDLPYEFIKMDQPLKEGTVHKIDAFAYRSDIDPRTKLDYPVVTSFGKADPAPVNAWLAQQRLQFSLPAFSCSSRSYLGFGWLRDGDGGATGYEDGGTTVTIEYLTTRMIEVSEGGSYYCGGAHPDNFLDHHFADTKTGMPIVAERLLRGWVARNSDGAVVDPASVEDPSELAWGPGDELVKYIAAHRQKQDAETEQECGIEELVASNLGIYLKDNKLVFTLSGLPNVNFACSYDMVSVPLKDARPLLTAAGARYFAELDQQ